MVKRARWAWWLVFAVGAIAMIANCSKEEEGPPPSSPKKTTRTSCKSPQSMTISELSPTMQPGVLRGKAKGSDGKEWTIQIELSDREDFKHKPGTYPLGDQTSYDGCRQCVIGYQGADELLDASKYIFQTGGSMRLDTVSSPPSAISKGSLEKVELREVTLNLQTGEVEEIHGGTCYRINNFDWDTTPAPGKGCQKAEDCGDPQTVACDVKTGTCVAFQCEVETGQGCKDNELCLAQEIGASYGSCYPTCTPFYPQDSCLPGFECVALDADQVRGKCLPPGPGIEGASCEPALLNTGCQPGLRCVGPEGSEHCTRTCDFFDNTVGCPAGQQCVYGGFCSAEPGDSASLGSPCGADAPEGLPCGSDGTTYRGVCTGGSCQQACRLGTVYHDCGEELVCTMGDGEAALPTCQPKLLDEEAL